MPTYEKAPAEVTAIVQAMLECYHGELVDAKVKVDCLMAKAKKDKNGDVKGAAITHGGYTCAGTAEIISYKQRVQGLGDALVTLDGDRWHEWSEEEQAALIDHELTHLELDTASDGTVKRDELDRPKLRLRKHDHQYGWFDCVARRHGGNSFEVQQADSFDETRKQLWFPFADDDQSKPAPRKKKGTSSITVSVQGSKPVTMTSEQFADAVESHFDSQRSGDSAKDRPSPKRPQRPKRTRGAKGKKGATV